MIHPRKDYGNIQDPDGIIPADEPVFLLRGGDALAGEVLRFYADLVRSRIRIGLPEADSDIRLANLARSWSDEFDRWPVKELPDTPSHGTPILGSPEELTERG